MDQDEIIYCIVDNQPFTFPAWKAKKFVENQWPKPKRCPKHAAEKRIERERREQNANRDRDY